MSFIGPRPLLKEYLSKFSELEKEKILKEYLSKFSELEKEKRHNVKPGISGL